MKLAIHILIYLTVAMILSSCGSGGSGNGNNANGGYSLVYYQSGNSIYKYEYNDIGQKIKTIEPDGDIFTYEYNTDNQLISRKVTTNNGDVYSSLFTYGNTGQLVKQEVDNGSIYLFGYDGYGNIIEKYNKTKNIKIYAYSYNTLNQRIKRVAYDGVTTDISYNTAGQIVKVKSTNSEGKTRYSTYEYNNNGQIKQGMRSNGDVLTYTYENKPCINGGFFSADKAYVSARCKK